MTRAIRQLLLPTLLVGLLLVPAQPAAASALDVLRDCADSDSIDQQHSTADLQAARGSIPDDLAEYGNCASLIDAALAASRKAEKSQSKSGPRGGSDSADLDGDGVVTPTERRKAARKAAEKRKRKQQLAALDNGLDQDGGGSFDDSSGGGTSLPLVLALIALLCAGAGGGAWYAAKRNPGFADALRRVAPPFRRS